MSTMANIPDHYTDNQTNYIVTLDDTLPQQIVAPTHQGGYSLGASEDTLDFERDIDALFSTTPPSTIDPSLLRFSWESQQNLPQTPSLPAPSDAATTSSASSWYHSQASSPPTSPEFVDDGCEKEESAETPMQQELLFSEEQLEELRHLFGLPPVAQPATTSALCPGTHPFATRPSADAPAHQYSPPTFTSDERPQQQHPGADVADAHRQGTGVQVTVSTDVDHPGLWIEGVPPSSSGGDPAPTSPGISREPTKPAPFKSSKTTHSPRKASSSKDSGKKPKKILPCTVPGCPQVFDRSYNLQQHISGKHNKERPHTCSVQGCPKAVQGYSRNYDLQEHISKKHPGLHGEVGATTPGFVGQGAQPM